MRLPAARHASDRARISAGVLTSSTLTSQSFLRARKRQRDARGAGGVGIALASATAGGGARRAVRRRRIGAQRRILGEAVLLVGKLLVAHFGDVLLDRGANAYREVVVAL